VGIAKEVENFIVSLSLRSDEGLKPTTTWLGAVFIARTSYELFHSFIRPFINPVTGLEWHTGFQEVKVPRFHDNGTEWW